MAQLLTVDIGRLSEGSEEEAAKLFRAAKEDGIFYLDLQDPHFRRLLETVDDVFGLSKGLFNLSEEEKMKYDIDELSRLKLYGYKPVGRNFGGLDGKRDGFESFTIPGKPNLDSSFARPPLLTSHLPSLTTLFTQTRQILGLLLSSLSSSLNLPPNASLANLHRDTAPSSDILRLLHYFAQPLAETGAPQASHTDLGTLTLLFTKSPGLQVLLRQRAEWAFVDPKPGCAIINIGDGLTMLTGGVLHSCLHRVAPLPGRPMEERYSLAYLQRAEHDVKMEPLPGTGSVEDGAGVDREVYTSQQWLEKKYGMLRRKTGRDGTEGSEIPLTGRVG